MRASSSASTTRRDVLLATNERTHLQRQVAGKCVESAKRRKVAAEIRVGKLEQGLGPTKVTESMFAEIDEFTTPGKRLADQFLGGARTERSDPRAQRS